MQERSQLGLKIIGAGFGRTGTSSLRTALAQLGFGPCYHMEEVIARPEHADVWHAAVRDEPIDWHELLDGYQAALDWPASYFWRELLLVYPDAKVLLTVRDPESWYWSISNTIFELLKDEDSIDGTRRSMTHELLFGRLFTGDVHDKDYVLGVYHSNIETVTRSVPASRLLAYDVREGWEPLCVFLERETPQQDFPHKNTTAEFRVSTRMKPLEN